MINKNKEITCPPCTHDCREGRDCPSIAINAQIIGYVEPQRTWVGLTDEEIDDFGYPHFVTNQLPSLRLVVRHLEAKLKEKNT